MAKVVIYSTPACQYCQMAKKYFQDNNIEYQDIDVSVSQRAAKEMMKKSGQMGVPVIIVTQDNGKKELVVGFDRAKLDRILKIS